METLILVHMLVLVIAMRGDSFTDTNYFNNQKHFTTTCGTVMHYNQKW